MKYLFLLAILCSMHVANAACARAAVITPTLRLPDTTSLPVQELAVTEKDKKAVLRWRADSLTDKESFYSVERSSNGIDFTLVGVSKFSGTGWNEFLDESPPKGKVFYRLKMTAGETTSYSPLVAAMPCPDVSCKFYPNPVDKVLIIRSESNLELLITDQFGKAALTDKFPAGLKVIDVSDLSPGIYVLTLFQRETGRQITEKLVKK